MGWYVIKNYGRGGEIRTRGLLVPNQTRYQAALRPDILIIAQHKKFIWILLL